MSHRKEFHTASPVGKERVAPEIQYRSKHCYTLTVTGIAIYVLRANCLKWANNGYISNFVYKVLLWLVNLTQQPNVVYKPEIKLCLSFEQSLTLRNT